MTINIYSTNRSPLTFDRENNQFREAIGNGVISGFQFYQGTPGSFKVSFMGGSLALNGMIITDDQVTTDFFDLVLLSGSDSHALIYAKYNPSTDSAPEYKYTSGTVLVPAQVDPADAAYSIVLCDVYIYSGSLSIADCLISNRPIKYNQDDLSKYIGLKKIVLFENIASSWSAGDYTLKFKAGHVAYLSPFKNIDEDPVNTPYGEVLLYTDTASAGDYDWEIVAPDSFKDFIVFYARGDQSAWNGQISSKVQIASFDDTGSLGVPYELESILGNATTLPTTENYPDRMNLSDITVLAIIDQRNQTLMAANNINMPIGAEFLNGHITDQLKTLSSTEYGTSELPVSNDIDIDNVIPNIATLKTATLDSAYDSFLLASDDGSGRVISANAGAVEIRNAALTEGTNLTSDQWLSSIRVHMDYDATGAANTEERGVDIVKIDAPNQTKAVSFRRPITIAAVDITGKSASITYVGSQVQVAITGVTVASLLASAVDGNDIPISDIAESYYLSFDSLVTGGDATTNANRQYYKLKINVGSNYFYLESVDGVTDLQSEVPAHFPTMPTTETVTVWREVSFGPNTVVENIEVDQTISGRAGGNVNITSLSVNGFVSTQDLIENVSVGNIGLVNKPYVPMMKIVATSPNGPSVAPTSLGRILHSCGRYVYKMNAPIGVAAQPVSVSIYNVSDMTLFGTVASTHDATVLSRNISICGDGKRLIMGYQRDSDGQMILEGALLNNLPSREINDTGFDVNQIHMNDIFMANEKIFCATSGSITDGLWVYEDTIVDFVTKASTIGIDLVGGYSIDGYGDKIVISGERFDLFNSIATLDLDLNIVHDGVLNNVVSGTLSPLIQQNIAINDKNIALVVDRDISYTYLLIYSKDRSTSSAPIYEIEVTNKGGLVDTKPKIRMNERYIYILWIDEDVGFEANNLYVYDLSGNFVASYADAFPPGPGQYTSGMDIDPYHIYLSDRASITVQARSLGRKPGWFRVEYDNDAFAPVDSRSYNRYRVISADGGF
jgi:hypothetical protein